MKTDQNQIPIDVEVIDGADVKEIVVPPEERVTRGTRVRKPIKTYDEGLMALKERTAEVELQRQARASSIVMNELIPQWSEEIRAVPNPFLRSGLFSVGHETDENREFRDNEKIVSLSNYNIRVTGKALSQDDLSVWMSLLSMARSGPISNVVKFTGYRLLKDLGWRMHSENYVRVKESIRRLKNNGLEISTASETAAYSGSLLRSYAFQTDEQDTRWWVQFEPEMAILLVSDNTTLLEWEVRKDIGSRSRLALWLHAFYASHRDPIPFRIEKLMELCGAKTKHLPTFKRDLVNACEKLKSEKIQFLASYEITSEDFLVVKKNPRFARLAASNEAKRLN
jgi:TrfA protein